MLQKIIALVLLLGMVLLSAVVSTELSLGANIRSMIIVIGGTFLTTAIAYPWSRFKETLAVLTLTFNHQDSGQVAKYIDEIVRLARINRFQGVRALDDEAQKVGNNFLRLGLELAADGRSRFEIREVLDKEFELHVSHRESQIGILQTMARMAPAFGLAGTLVGLMKMFTQLADPTQLGMGMAVALLTTFYGIMVANLVLIPLSKKLKEYLRFEARGMALIVEGIMAIADHEHPTAVDHRLRSAFVSRLEGGKGKTSALDEGRRAARGLVTLKQRPVR